MKLFTQLAGIENAFNAGLISRGTADGLKLELLSLWGIINKPI
jgi:hypothetical protein